MLLLPPSPGTFITGFVFAASASWISAILLGKQTPPLCLVSDFSPGQIIELQDKAANPFKSNKLFEKLHL